jgi:hypothetical protein
MPAWTCSQYPKTEEGLDQAVSNFWRNETLKTHFILAWKHIALRYKNETCVIGYDLLNEPLRGTLSELEFAPVLYSFYESLIDEIKEVDNNHIFFYEPSLGYDNPYARKLNRTNIVYSPHFYREWRAYSGNISAIETQFIYAYNKTTLWNIPLWIGEFGTTLASANYSEWIRTMLTLMDNYRLGWAWWTYGKSNVLDDFQLCWANGTEKTQFLQFLDRPYPKSSQIPLNFLFNYSTSQFLLRTDIAIGNFTIEIYIPSRHYLTGFNVLCTASQWGKIWSEKEKVLMIWVILNSDRASLTIQRI